MQALPYNEALDWIQFHYTGDWLGDYVEPGSKNINFSNLLGGGGIFYGTTNNPNSILWGLLPGVYVYAWPPQT